MELLLFFTIPSSFLTNATDTNDSFSVMHS